MEKFKNLPEPLQKLAAGRLILGAVTLVLGVLCHICLRNWLLSLPGAIWGGSPPAHPGRKSHYRPCERIEDRAGNVLDKEPEKLLEIKGITENKLEKTRESCLTNRGARDVIAFLAPHEMSPSRAVKLYKRYNKP